MGLKCCCVVLRRGLRASGAGRALAAATVAAAAAWCPAGLPGQEVVSPVRTDLLPPAPESRAAVECQMPRPALLTGAASLSVPVWTVEADGFSLPVVLQYHSNGARVFDPSAPTGLGWTLQPALRATRTIMGRPDEHYEPCYSFPPVETYLTAYECVANNMRHPHDTGRRLDCQHDIVTLALPCRTLTRVLDATKSPYEFVGTGDGEYSVAADARLDSITVTGPDGTRYVFGAPYEYACDGSIDPYENRTGWALRRIDLASGRCISFRWDLTGNNSFTMTYIGGASYIDNRDPYQFWGNNFDPDFENTDIADGVLSRVNPDGVSLLLRGIDFPGGSVEFGLGGPQRCFYTDIRVLSGTSVVRSVSLSYRETGYCRAVLTGIDTGEGAPYAFDYHPGGVHNPQAQDWWGFYNGRDNQSLEPRLSFRTLLPHAADNRHRYHSPLGDADRSVDEQAMHADMLRAVTYPTGATAAFEYEAHRFAPVRTENDSNIRHDYDPLLSFGGGLRVRSITMSEGPGDASPQVVRYSYPPATVRAVPSASTFVNVQDAAMPLGNWVSITDKYYCPVRLVSILPVSDYMRYDIGEVPLWYERVTETHSEGKTEYRFADINPRHNLIINDFGRRAIGSLNRVFSNGPQLVETTVYRSAGSGYEKVSRTASHYSLTPAVSLMSFHVLRDMIQMGTGSAASPDLDGGRYFDGGHHGYIDLGYDYHGERFPYSVVMYGIVGQAERLVRTETTVYHDGDSMTTVQSTAYRGGTGLPERITTACGDRSRTVEVAYPEASRGGVEAAMVSAGAVGVALRGVTTRGSAVTTTEAEYEHLSGRLFRTARTRRWHSGMADTLVSPRYSYNGLGQLAGITDGDGVSTAFLWGYGSTLPVWQIRGSTYAEAVRRHGQAASRGAAEGLALESSASGLCTRALYRPLVGVASLTSEWGSTDAYAYDGAGRLSSSATPLGTSATYSYRVSHDGSNHARSERWLTAAGRKHAVTDHYDGRGRPVERRDHQGGATSPSGLPSSGSASVFTEYDAMGRVARVSRPAPSRPAAASDWTDYGYEASPRGLRTSELKAGAAWKESGRRATVTRGVNKASGAWSCPRLEADATGAISHGGALPAGMASVMLSVDEDGREVYEFADWEGRPLLRREGSDGDYLDTRYVYDPWGRLRWILPPVIADGDYDAGAQAVADHAFEYRHDGADRVVYARVPGSAAAEYAYSPGGRLAAERLPAMGDGQWLLHYHDRLGRAAVRGTAAMTGASLAAHIACCRADFSPGASDWHYSGSYPPGFGIKSAWYYDGHGFATGVDGLAFVPQAGYALSRLGSPWGLPTGSLDCGDDGIPRLEARYHDALGREVQRRRQTAAGLAVTDTRHAYHGAPEAVRTSVGGAVREIVTEYDGAARPVRQTVVHGGDTAVTTTAYDPAGLVASQKMGARVTREYAYDEHGWPVGITTSLGRTIEFRPRPPALDPDSLLLPVPNSYYGAIELPPGGLTVVDFVSEYVETLRYADGASPRYTGEVSSRELTNGARYDYRYDAHDRLVAADYTPGPGAPPGEDFSAAYEYDAIGRPTRIRRWGVIRLDGTAEKFGPLDNIRHYYDGARLSSVRAANWPAPFYGQTGYGAAQYVNDYEYNSAGLLVGDANRGITSVRYNHLGLPVSTQVTDPAVSGRTYSISNTYSSDGTLVATSRSQHGALMLIEKSIYVDGFTIGERSLIGRTVDRVDFPGGYFDNGGVHWLLRDGLGSVGMAVDDSGKVEQHVQYYPYGEPHREPQGQPYLYGGKERRRFGGLNDYDFHARFLNPAAALWHAPDPHASRYPWLSPYAFCASNPVRYSDPTGMDIFMFNKYGVMVNKIAYEYDKIEIDNSDKLGYYESRTMELGTISYHEAYNKKGDRYNYLEIKGDSNGREAFETLAKGTSVEFSLMQAGEEGDNGRNYISTSHSKDDNASSIDIINEVIGVDGGLRSHTHNHPSTMLSPSVQDIRFAKDVEEKRPGKIKFSIYSSVPNPVLGNEVQYDSKTKPIEASEYLFNNLMEIDRKLGNL